jgi:hypothetical protein
MFIQMTKDRAFLSSLNQDNHFSDDSPLKQLSADEPEFDDPFANLVTGEDSPKTINHGFITRHSREYEWLVQNAHKNTFAKGCLVTVNQRGELSRRQFKCVQQTIARQQLRRDPKTQAEALKNAMANDPQSKDIYQFLASTHKHHQVTNLLGNLVQYGLFTAKQKGWIRIMIQVGLMA